MGLAEKYPVRYTVQDYLRWQGDWELIEGIPYAMASPRPINQYIGYKIMLYFNGITSALPECAKCYMLYETDWYISHDTVIRPDLMVLCGELPEKVESSPELVVEITSPSSKHYDEGLKFEIYQRERVKYFVLVYPEEKKVKVFEISNGKYREKLDKKFDLNGCNVELDFEEVFSGLG